LARFLSHLANANHLTTPPDLGAKRTLVEPIWINIAPNQKPVDRFRRKVAKTENVERD
jgi:hypothetical protein